jgi:hypothetical protein
MLITMRSFQGVNYFSKMCTDLDALKSESLGSILRELNVSLEDLICVVFDESIDYSAIDGTPASGVPLQVLKDAVLHAVNEPAVQQDIAVERRQLRADGVFIPMLRFGGSGSTKEKMISGGRVIPAASSSFGMLTVSDSHEEGSRADGATASVSLAGTESSLSRLDV